MEYLLDILIPLYKKFDVVEKVIDLSNSTPESSSKVRWIFSDDSDDEMFANRVIKEIARFPNIIYTTHLPTGNAVDNWNFLLDFSTAEYRLLMHHDEFFSMPKDLLQLLTEIKKGFDVYFLDVHVKNTKGQYCKLSPSMFKKFILRYFPKYLYRRNLVGPPSAIVVRRDKTRYQSVLIYLVDVNYLINLLTHIKFSFSITNIRILSTPHSQSITSGLNIDEIKTQELCLLKHKSPFLDILFDSIYGLWLIFRNTLCFISSYLHYNRHD